MLVTFTSHSVVLYCTQLMEGFVGTTLGKNDESMVGATLRKSLGSPMPKQSDDSCLQEYQEQLATCWFLCPVKLIF